MLCAVYSPKIKSFIKWPEKKPYKYTEFWKGGIQMDQIFTGADSEMKKTKSDLRNILQKREITFGCCNSIWKSTEGSKMGNHHWALWQKKVVQMTVKLRVNLAKGIWLLPGDGVTFVEIRSVAAKKKFFFPMQREH